MDFRGEHYFAASAERLRQAKELLTEGNFALSMYCSGLAVECLLRAFQSRVSSQFDSRHDLLKLLESSKFLQACLKGMAKEENDTDKMASATRRIRAAIGDASVLWHNNYRFTSEARLKAHLFRIGRIQRNRGKGNPLKKVARDLLEVATTIVDFGVGPWTSG